MQNKEEFNLSKKRIEVYNFPSHIKEYNYLEEDVKEFIKLLKEFIQKEPSVTRCGITEKFIDKLVGEELK